MTKIDELTFTRAIDPAVIQWIPRYLFEQIEGLDDSKIDMLYAYATDILTLPAINNNGQLVRVANPLIWFAVLHDISHQIKGFLWVKINIIEKLLFVYIFSIDKEYQSTDGAVNKRLIDYLSGLPIPDELKSRIKMETLKPKVCEKQGWKRSKKVIMEYLPEKNDVVSKNKAKNNQDS